MFRIRGKSDRLRGTVPKRLRQRCAFWKPAFGGWRVVIAAIIFLWGLFGNFRSDFISATEQDKWRLPTLFPRVPWYWLVIVLLGLTVIVLLEGGYRSHTSILQKLKRKYIRRRKRINRKFMAERAIVGQYAKDLTAANVEKEKLEDELHSLRGSFAELETEKDSLKFQLEDLKKLRLIVNTNRQSEVRVEVEDGKYFITAYLKIHVENHALVSVPLRNLEASLLRKTKRGAEKEIPRSKTPLTALAGPEALLNHDVLAGRVSEPLWYFGVVDMLPGYWKRLNHTCFLRVTMEAMRQPPYSVDLDVDWQSLGRNGKVYVTPRK